MHRWSDRDVFMRYLGGAVGHEQIILHLLASTALSKCGPEELEEDSSDMGNAVSLG